ncbi:MAG: 23S rRNA (uracil(1939)-C(5))-methyltransferase RlmD [Bacteroidetes bacterium]|nr:23S rRNA (uracil(1939)-C(5))-methyltransferase RlmD [Bacteroidota bacterium]
MRRFVKKQLPLIENVSITDAGSEGKAVAKIDELVVFVQNAVPGDVADLQLVMKKKNFAEARAVKFHHYSEKRVVPICQHFGLCGGCKWQNMSYEWQLFYKQKQVTDNLTRIGKIELPTITPILPSAQTQYYRNKLEYTFSNKKWLTNLNENDEGIDMNALGFHIPQRFDKILDIEHCHLQAAPSNDIRNAIRDYAIERNLSFFDLKSQQGFLRTLIIRSSSNGELMVILTFFREEEESRIALLNFVKSHFPQVTSLMYVINSKGNDTIQDQEVICFYGAPFITEQMEELSFRIGPKSFYQTNSAQAYELYKIAREFADFKGHELVYDLYTGTGTIANFIANKVKKVVGIEYVPEAIEDAKVNSSLNNISNTVFYAGDMSKVLNDAFIAENGNPDCIITDPPRAGMSPDVVEKLLQLEASKIVYVSCNAATQARDLALMDSKYKVTKVQPVDMFPHTHHVENVVLLELK